jgi:hypothetical protein
MPTAFTRSTNRRGCCWAILRPISATWAAWRRNCRAAFITGLPLASWTKPPRNLADGMPEVVPRFSRLAPNDDSLVLIFLDDTSLVSRRAEELTLSSLGRLSASIAHEIRNPLAAIRYSAQLLAESTDMNPTDLRMVEIINNHCSRLNEIIENILQLSRRERSRPETLNLGDWSHSFVEEYRQGNDLGADSLRVIDNSPAPVAAVADPQQLQQVIWNLVQNALAVWTHARRVGARDGGGAARRTRRADSGSDRSRPGIAPKSPRRSSSRSTPRTNTARAWGSTLPSRWRKPIKLRWNTCAWPAAEAVSGWC